LTRFSSSFRSCWSKSILSKYWTKCIWIILYLEHNKNYTKNLVSKAVLFSKLKLSKTKCMSCQLASLYWPDVLHLVTLRFYKIIPWYCVCELVQTFTTSYIGLICVYDKHVFLVPLDFGFILNINFFKLSLLLLLSAPCFPDFIKIEYYYFSILIILHIIGWYLYLIFLTPC
jgi:hypothetical protein